MSEFRKPAHGQILLLISESMEARMQSREALLQLQSTMTAIQRIHASCWPGRHADDLPPVKSQEVLSSLPSVSVVDAGTQLA